MKISQFSRDKAARGALAAAAVVTALAAVIAIIGASSARAQFGDDFGESGSSYPYHVPLGLNPPPVPADNAITDAKVALGKDLYFDKRLSQNDTVSCETCHNPMMGWTDHKPVSTGIHGQHGTRNAPTVLNSAYNQQQFWDGRAPSLEKQIEGPVANPVEMGFSLAGAAKRIGGIKGYAPLFQAAFGSPKVTFDRIEKAIASFERTVLTGNSPYDRYVAGDTKALSPQAAAGMALFFGKANCDACHAGKNFSDGDYHNIGVGMNSKHPDWGRYLVTKVEADRGKFKTPTLRDLPETYPYMHDGSVKTLAEVIKFYNQGGEKNKWLDPQIRPLHLDDAEQAELVAFLDALNGTQDQVAPPKTLPQ